MKCSSHCQHFIAISRIGYCGGLSIIRNRNLENGCFDRNVVYTEIWEKRTSVYTTLSVGQVGIRLVAHIICDTPTFI